MLASKHKCKVLEKIWLTPTVMKIRFTSKKRIKFEAGQFLSVYVPDLVSGKFLRRAYSFASAPELDSYELCIKYLASGAGSEYFASLKSGDEFECSAPYGHFVCRIPAANQNICFLSTSTGIAPFRSMVLSQRFQVNKPKKCWFLFGSRTEQEILYPGEFEAQGLEVVNAVSRPGQGYAGFHGRITDYLRALPNSWHWHNTDFYICGNQNMIEELSEILRAGHGVQPERIISESFSVNRKTKVA